MQDGWRWLNHRNLQNNGTAACWLASYQGEVWLNSEKGQEWLKAGVMSDLANPNVDEDNASSWWLATAQGSEWLRTEEGDKFLRSDEGKLWRWDTHAGAIWRMSDSSEADLQRKADAQEAANRISNWASPPGRPITCFLQLLDNYPRITFVRFPQAASEATITEDESYDTDDTDSVHE